MTERLTPHLLRHQHRRGSLQQELAIHALATAWLSLGRAHSVDRRGQTGKGAECRAQCSCAVLVCNTCNSRNWSGVVHWCNRSALLHLISIGVAVAVQMYVRVFQLVQIHWREPLQTLLRR
jgi:hypothetical protein